MKYFFKRSKVSIFKSLNSKSVESYLLLKTMVLAIFLCATKTSFTTVGQVQPQINEQLIRYG